MFLFEDYLNKIYGLRRELGNNCDKQPRYKEKVLKEFEAYLVGSEEYYDKLNEFYEYIRENPNLFLKLIDNILSLWEKYGEDRLVNREYYKNRNRLFRQIFINEPNQNIFDNFNIAIRSDLEELEKLSQEMFLSYIKARVPFQHTLEKVKGAAVSDIQERVHMVNKLIRQLSEYKFTETIEPLKLETISLFGVFSKKKKEMAQKLNEERKETYQKEEERIEEKKHAVDQKCVILKKRFEKVLEQLDEIGNNLRPVKTVKDLSKIKEEIESIAPKEIEKLRTRHLKEFILTEGFKPEVVSMYREKSKKEPDNPEIYNILGIDYLNKNMVNRGLEEFKKAIEMNINCLDAYKNIWWAYYDNNLLDEGIEYFKKRIETNPDDAVAHNCLGYSYHHKKIYYKAIEEYDESIRLKPDFDWPHLNLGWAYIDGEYYDDAIKAFKRVVKLKPGNGSAHHGLGTAFYRKARYGSLKRQAIDELKWSLKIEPNNPQAHLQLARIYEDGGEYTQALENYELALEYLPSGDFAKEIREKIQELQELKAKWGG